MIKVLIVDDDVATVEVIQSSVDWGKLYIDEVLTAYNVSAARKILQENKIDIIISDIEMPQETGLDLLKWVRKEKMDCELLLLTCHENFTYATTAIDYEVAAYLIKPFDINIMELNLQKIVTKLEQKRSLKKTSDYGAWMEKNHRLMKLDFWKMIIEGEIFDVEKINKEINSRHLDVDFDKKYGLIYSKLSNCEGDLERYGRSTFEYIVEGFHSEILMDMVENERVIKYPSEDVLSFITICEEEQLGELNEKCERLIETCRKYFKATVTCCISNSYKVTELAGEKHKLQKLLQYNINFYGKVFYEHEMELPSNNDVQILDLGKIIPYVENKDKSQILHCLKQVFMELSSIKRMNQHSLYLLKQEIMQVIYADLMKHGIQATKLFYDEHSIRIAEHATDSTVDMIRWVNYLLEKTFSYEEEIEKSVTIIDKINRYIHEHYAENLSRNEIAGVFYLTPEYLAKLYKKKTGMNLKDYINEYRIEKAKELLRSGDKNVSDIAEIVGFDNFSYFSTLFKKLSGLSPKEYKNS